MEIVTAIIYSLTFIMFLDIVYLNFNDLLGWSMKEYYFFVLFEGFSLLFFGMFWFGIDLKQYLITGNMNNFLIRPVNTFIQYFANTSQFFAGFTSIVYLIPLILSFILIDFDFSYIRLVLLIFFLAFSGLFFVLSNRLLDSFAFFMKSTKIVLRTYKNIYFIFDKYPATMFKNNIKYLTFFCANAYYTSFSVQFIFNHMSFDYFFLLFTMLIFFSFICSILIYILWHFGLKRYEAYG